MRKLEILLVGYVWVSDITGRQAEQALCKGEEQALFSSPKGVISIDYLLRNVKPRVYYVI